MRGRIHFSVLLTVTCILGFFPRGSELSGSPQPEKKDIAIRWFNEGKFDNALPLFSKLCYDYPYDFLVKYYYGASLVETGNFGLDSEKNLVLASSSDVPVKVYYYLGRLFHGRGDWNNAQRFYNRFRNNAEAPEIAALEVDEMIQLCFKEVNPFVAIKTDSLIHSGIQEIKRKDTAEPEFIPHSADSAKAEVHSNHNRQSDLIKKEVKDSVQNESLQILPAIQDLPLILDDRKDTLTISDSKPVQVQKNPDPVRYIDFQINEKVTYPVEEMFHVAEAKNEFRIAGDMEIQLDSLLKVVQVLRKQYHLMMNPLIRDSLAIRIQNLEYQTMVLNKEVDQHYFKSRKLEQEWWNTADYSSLEEYQNWKDSLWQLRNAPIFREVMPVTADILDSAGVQVLTDSTAINPEVDPDPEIIYKIQIGAFNKGIPTQRKLQFDRLEKIRTIELLSMEKGLTIYTTGNLKKYEDALKLQAQIRLEGIKDAFVIAVRNGKKVNLPVENSLKQNDKRKN